MTDTTQPPTLPDKTHLGRIALTVSNLSDVTEFYRDVVGLSVIHRSEQHAVLGVDDDIATQLLVLNQEPSAPPRQRTETGLFHTAFRVPSRAALGDALQRIRTQWALDGAAAHRVSEALYLTDPEGNGVEIYRDFPRDSWPVTADGHVQMVTDPLDLSSIDAAATGAGGVPKGTSIGHVHLEVSALDSFEEFYVGTLGFEMQATVRGAMFVAAGGYHHHIGANTWNGRTPPGEGRGLDWFEIVLPNSSDLERVREWLRSRYISISEAEEGTELNEKVGMEEGFAVTDADGTEIRFATNGNR